MLETGTLALMLYAIRRYKLCTIFTNYYFEIKNEWERNEKKLVGWFIYFHVPLDLPIVIF